MRGKPKDKCPDCGNPMTIVEGYDQICRECKEGIKEKEEVSMMNYPDDFIEKNKDKLPFWSTQEILEKFFEYLKEFKVIVE